VSTLKGEKLELTQLVGVMKKNIKNLRKVFIGQV